MSRPVKVMQIVHDLDYGGMQRVVVDLCLHFDRAQFQMHACCLNGLGPNADELKQAGIPCFLVKKNPGLDYTLPIRLARLFRKQRVQVVHTHGINPFFYGTLASILAGRPITIQTDHARGIFPVARREMASERILARFTDRIIAVSEGVKADLVRYEHIRPEKIQVIYNGIDGQKFRAPVDTRAKRNELGLPLHAVVVGVGVRLTEQKGITYLIQALAKLAPAHPDIRLLIVGDGALRRKLEKLSEEVGVRGQVVFTGFRDDMGDILQAMDIYALPSLWEGHPLVLLEAMAAGKPVVATDIPGSREVVVQGQTGMLVPPQDSEALAQALSLLVQDQTLRERMGREGSRAFEERFRVERMVTEYEGLYERCLAARRARKHRFFL
jgi:sugar transferase (PEP-CTERM/EpsH1 system associated)